MAKLFQPKSPRYGFRFWWTDAVVLLVGIAFALYWRQKLVLISWLIVLVLGHFFLFCNVFRIRRNYELVWSLALCINFFFHCLLLKFEVFSITLWQIPFTLIFLFLEITSERYHGIFSSDPDSDQSA